MLKKHAFTITLVYVNVIGVVKKSTKVGRKMRNLMKPYIDFAIVFEKDREEIVNDKELDEDAKKNEIETLLNETIDLPVVSGEILDLCEEASIDLTEAEINQLLCYEW